MRGKKVLDELRFNRLKCIFAVQYARIGDKNFFGVGLDVRLYKIKKVEKSPPFLPQILP